MATGGYLIGDAGDSVLASRTLLRKSYLGQDAKTTGTKTIFTTAADQGQFVVVMFIVEVASATAISAGGTVSLGTNSTNYDNIFTGAGVQPTAAKACTCRVPGASQVTVDASTALIANLSVAATGTSGTYNYHVIGFYIG